MSATSGAENPSFWGKQSLFLITGASRGLGRAIALAFSQKSWDSKALFILLARDEKKLQEVKSEIAAGRANVHVHIAARDLSKPNANDLREIIGTALRAHNSEPGDFDQLWLVHNAGSLGDIRKHAQDFGEFSQVQSYFDLNLTSLILLTSAFMEVFRQSQGRITVVHISSLAAKEPFKGMALYCSGKAARDMYCRVLALENPHIRVLSYSPGPLETDMVDEILDHGQPEMQEYFREMRKKGTLLKCETTVKNLIHLLEKDDYKSGDNIDVFDRF